MKSGLNLPFYLFQQFREGHRIGLPGVDLNPVSPGELLQALCDPVRISGLGIGDDQRTVFFLRFRFSVPFHAHSCCSFPKDMHLPITSPVRRYS